MALAVLTMPVVLLRWGRDVGVGALGLGGELGMARGELIGVMWRRNMAW
jgi:hypothetical protein